MHGKTIQVFLPDGNPRGVRIAEITSRTVEVISVPRAHLDIASKREELSKVGVYFLIGNPDDEPGDIVYVGETEDCLKRLREHNRNKDFWRLALVVTSKGQYFTKSHVSFLEWHCHKMIDRAERYPLENTNAPRKPSIPEPMRADLEDIFETMSTLVATLGYPLFDEIKVTKRSNELLTCKGKDAVANGEYTEDGLVVFEGSTANVDETDSARGTWVTKIRDALVQSGALVQNDGIYRFTRNHAFSSPSAAAVAVLGRNANGWTEWKYADGRTLDEAKRKAVVEEG